MAKKKDWRYPVPLDSIAAKIICVCGSFRFLEQMKTAEEILVARGLDCRMPSEDVDVARGVQSCFRRIDASEAVLVVNPGGYIGASVLLDMGYAWARNKPIYLSAEHDDPAVMSLVSGVIDLKK